MPHPGAGALLQAGGGCNGGGVNPDCASWRRTSPPGPACCGHHWCCCHWCCSCRAGCCMLPSTASMASLAGIKMIEAPLYMTPWPASLKPSNRLHTWISADAAFSSSLGSSSVGCCGGGGCCLGSCASCGLGCCLGCCARCTVLQSCCSMCGRSTGRRQGVDGLLLYPRILLCRSTRAWAARAPGLQLPPCLRRQRRQPGRETRNSPVGWISAEALGLDGLVGRGGGRCAGLMASVQLWGGPPQSCRAARWQRWC